MGYRSNVRLRTTKEGYEIMKQGLSEEKYNLLKNANIKEKYDAVTIELRDIKWYEKIEGYEDVDKFMQLLDELQSRDIDFQYMRIGEEYADIEERWHINNGSFESFCLIRDFED